MRNAGRFDTYIAKWRNLGTWETFQPGNRGNYNLEEMPPDDNLRICSTWDDLSNLEN